MDNLDKAGFDSSLIAETKNWSPDEGKKISLQQDQVAQMPQTLKSFKFGLGWNTKCDLDASVILLDKDGNLIYVVYFNKDKRRYKNGVIHGGDNLSGGGGEDDEIITVNLDELGEEVDSIWPVINIYTTNMTFSDVKGAFCRIYDETSNAEFVKYNLEENTDNISNGCVVASLHKYADSWSLKARGYYVRDIRFGTDMEKICQQVRNNDFSNVKVGPNGQYAHGENERPEKT